MSIVEDLIKNILTDGTCHISCMDCPLKVSCDSMVFNDSNVYTYTHSNGSLLSLFSNLKKEMIVKLFSEEEIFEAYL